MLEPNIKLNYYKVWYEKPRYKVEIDDNLNINVFYYGTISNYVLIEATDEKWAEKLGLNYIMSKIDSFMKKYVKITSVERDYGGY